MRRADCLAVLYRYLDLAVAFVAMLALPAVIVIVHELAHAAVARLVGLGVQQINVGGGAALRAWWWGSTLVTIGRWPDHGLVYMTHPAVVGLRWRAIAAILAGPLANVACAAPFVVVYLQHGDDSRVPTTVVVGCVLSLVAVVTGFVPARWGRHDQQSSDVLLVAQWAQITPEELEATIEHSRLGELHHRFDRMLAHGDHDAAMCLVDEVLAREEVTWHWLESRALLRSAMGDGQGALADHRESSAARAAYYQQLEDQVPAERKAEYLAERRSAESAHRINAAYFLAMTGDARDLREADEMTSAVSKQVRSGSNARAGAQRTRGLVLLRLGKPVLAQSLLEASLRCSDSSWMRGLSMEYLALACAAQGRGREASRWRRRARRFGPHSKIAAAVTALLPAAPQ